MLVRFISEDPAGFVDGPNLYAYVGGNPINRVDPTGLYWFRQPWQEAGVVGRRGTIVSPGGAVSELVETSVPAGYTFGAMHDGFVDAATSVGVPDWLANIPSMLPLYGAAIITEGLRTAGILDQPTRPSAQQTQRTSSPAQHK